MKIIDRDPWLKPFEAAITGRHQNAINKETELVGRGTLKDFAAGHQYRVTVSVVTKDGYVFGNYQDGEVEAYLGDERADEIDDWEEPETNIGLRKTYTVTAKWLPGDANEDGKVDMLDALRVVQYVNGKTGVINLKNADVTGDGKAAIEDARLIGQWAAGWNVGLK